jgi:hypothetical protein
VMVARADVGTCLTGVVEGVPMRISRADTAAICPD